MSESRISLKKSKKNGSSIDPSGTIERRTCSLDLNLRNTTKRYHCERYDCKLPKRQQSRRVESVLRSSVCSNERLSKVSRTNIHLSAVKNNGFGYYTDAH